MRVRPGGYRFLPNGSGLVYLPFLQSLDFWLLDFATKTPRQLTRLTNQGVLRTFDMTPDGKQIVFDRSRENSDIVLIDLPSTSPSPAPAGETRPNISKHDMSARRPNERVFIEGLQRLGVFPVGPSFRLVCGYFVS